MRNTKFKFAAAVFTFIIGIASVSLWLIHPFSMSQALRGVPVDAVVTEDADEYAVYSTIISEMFVKNRDHLKQVVISDQTSYYPDTPIDFMPTVESLKKDFPSVSEEVLADYNVKQGQIRTLSPSLSLPVRYILVNVAAYKNKYKSEPDVMFELSRVGFNRERSQAFMYVDYSCEGRLCGSGNYVRLEKVDGVWMMKGVINGWSSSRN